MRPGRQRSNASPLPQGGFASESVVVEREDTDLYAEGVECFGRPTESQDFCRRLRRPVTGVRLAVGVVLAVFAR